MQHNNAHMLTFSVGVACNATSGFKDVHVHVHVINKSDVLASIIIIITPRAHTQQG